MFVLDENADVVEEDAEALPFRRDNYADQSYFQA